MIETISNIHSLVTTASSLATLNPGELAGSAFAVGITLILLALFLGVIALLISGDSDSSVKVSLGFLGTGVIAGGLGLVAILLIVPVSLIAAASYTPPVVPVPASKVSLTQVDGRDRQVFDVVCSGRKGKVELVGKHEGRLFIAKAYRLKIKSDRIDQPASFSVGLRWENKGSGSRFGGQPSWMENVASGDRNIRADGTWQAGYLERPIILSEEGEYVLRVSIEDGPCPHLISIQ